MFGRYCSMLISLALSVIVTGSSAPAWAAASAGASASPGNVTIYLAPASKGGKDSNTGLTSSSPILTLTHAQQVLRQVNPTGDVTVRIEQGTYVANAITWSFYVPLHTISFMPANYTGGGRPPGGDPVFVDPTSNGVHIGQTWFTAILLAARPRCTTAATPACASIMLPSRTTARASRSTGRLATPGTRAPSTSSPARA